MVKIKKAKPIGFCFGVKRAINIAHKALENKTKIFSLGPIIHNPLVVKQLSDKGMKVISDISALKSGKILIRSHGVRPQIREAILTKGIDIIDATCPFVERSHKIVDGLKKEGFLIIIVGEKKHPEVAALAEAAGEKTFVVIRPQQLRKISLKGKRVGVLAQSTLTQSLFKEVVIEVLEKNPTELKVFDTICKDVTKRQLEAIRLSQNTDLMLVIGGKISANTKRLTQLCKSQKVKTYHLESEREIDPNWFKNVKCVGIISGSSTPKSAVDKVVAAIKTAKK